MRTREPGATLYRLIGSGSTPPTKGICNPNGSRYSHGIRYCAKRPHMAASAPYQIDENAQLEYWICIQYLKRSEEHTSELQSREKLVCRLLLEKKNTITNKQH